MDKEIEKFALHNAIKYEGKANPGAVLGQVFADDPKRKEQTKELAQKVQVIVKQVNSLSLEEQKARLQKIAPELLEEKKKKKKKNIMILYMRIFCGCVLLQIKQLLLLKRWKHFTNMLKFL